jgi:hypothetical protein
MLPLRHRNEPFHTMRILFHPSLVRPLTLVCLIVLFGAILPMWAGSTPNALAWSASNLFGNSDFESGALAPFTQTAGPAGAAFVTNNGRNHTPGGTYNLQINGVGQNVDVKQRVDGVTEGPRYYLGSFGTIDSGTAGGPVGIAYGWGANNYPPPNYQNCGFSYANWNGTVTVASYGLMSCDFAVPHGYNYVAPKMSFNAASPHWAATDDWYLAAAPYTTTSHYVDTRDPNTLSSWGTTAGQHGASGLIILDFGQPWYDSTSNSYGTISFADKNFISIADIETLVESFLQGYWNSPGSSAEVVVGTNNQGAYENYAHGAHWSQMVLDLRNYIQQQGFGSRESVFGGSDIEMAWSQPGPVNDWINGYESISGYPSYIDFGDAEGMSFDVWYYDSNGVGHAGCPTCGQSPTNGWLEDNVWNAAWGANAAYPFPEIYRTDGVNASQWYQLSLSHSSNPMYFPGTLTEQGACSQNGCPKFCQYTYCASANNSPAIGWGQLSQFLNFDQSVYRAINNSSDIKW